MRICTIGAAALSALAVAGGAQAKGPDTARLCGASGCTTVRGGGGVAGLLDWMGSSFTLVDAPRPGPYYRITLRDRGTLFMTMLWLPSRHRIRVFQPVVPFAPDTQHPYWRPVSARGAAVLGRAVAGLRPFSAPRAWR